MDGRRDKVPLYKYNIQIYPTKKNVGVKESNARYALLTNDNFDITKKKTLSVVSKKSMDQIAKKSKLVWTSKGASTKARTRGATASH